MLGSIFEFEQKDARTNGKKKYDQQKYPRLMPPADILVAYDQQILPYLNISNRYCKFQCQEALGHREILLFHIKSMVKYDHNHLNEMLQGRRTGVFLQKCMFSHHVIDLISINPTSQVILRIFIYIDLHLLSKKANPRPLLLLSLSVFSTICFNVHPTSGYVVVLELLGHGVSSCRIFQALFV